MADLVIGHLRWHATSAQAYSTLEPDPHLEPLTGKLPFLLEGNWGHNHTACILEEVFPTVVNRNKV